MKIGLGFFLIFTLVSEGLAQRVVSLAPNLTEITCRLGACDRLVGVTEFCEYPESVKTLPKVGGSIDPNLELILSLKPDLVLALPEHQNSVEKLQRLGVATHSIQNYHLEDIFSSITKIGGLIDRKEAAETLVAELKERVHRLTRQVGDRPRCLMVLGHGATADAIKEVYIVGKIGFLNQLLELAGGVNAFSKEKPFFPKLDQEGLLNVNPDIIIELIPQQDLGRKKSEAKIKAWQGVVHLKAVQNKRVHLIHASHLLQAGPRFVETLEKLVAILEQP